MTFKIPANQCDQRPVTTEAGEFEGYAHIGFEDGRFVLSGNPAKKVQLHFLGPPAAGYHYQWPDSLLEGAYGYTCLLVRGIGTLTGPGRSGDVFSTGFFLRLDSVTYVQDPGHAACHAALARQEGRRH